MCVHVCARVEVLRRKNVKEVIHFLIVVIYWRRGSVHRSSSPHKVFSLSTSELFLFGVDYFP